MIIAMHFELLVGGFTGKVLRVCRSETGQFLIESLYGSRPPSVRCCQSGRFRYARPAGRGFRYPWFDEAGAHADLRGGAGAGLGMIPPEVFPLLVGATPFIEILFTPEV